MYRTVVAATFTLLFLVVGLALVDSVASAPCNGDGCPPPPCNGDGCPPPPCNGDGCPPPPCNGDGCPPPQGLCHNIGGPRSLGANCDGTGFCTYDTGSGNITVAPGNFLGIIIGTNSANALAAHIAHGDGPILLRFNPPLHLASTGQNHQASNVECLGQRIVPQPPE